MKISFGSRKQFHRAVGMVACLQRTARISPTPVGNKAQLILTGLMSWRSSSHLAEMIGIPRLGMKHA